MLPMTTDNQIAETLSKIIALGRALDAIEPHRFMHMIMHADTAYALYGVLLEFNYAAQSKELRDTGDERVHALCNEIKRSMQKLDVYLRMTLVPSSPQQKQSWDHAVTTAPGGKYAFRDDGSLEISLLDSALRRGALRVKRIWSHVGDYDGAWTDFTIELHDNQINAFRTKYAAVVSLESAFDALRTALDD